MRCYCAAGLGIYDFVEFALAARHSERKCRNFAGNSAGFGDYKARRVCL